MEQQSTECPVEALDSEDVLFMLYTSGSTGKPKGLVHTQAGYLLYTGMTHQVSTVVSTVWYQARSKLPYTDTAKVKLINFKSTIN